MTETDFILRHTALFNYEPFKAALNGVRSLARMILENVFLAFNVMVKYFVMRGML